MASKFETFKELHAGSTLFVLPNAWDAASAAIIEESNYPAVATSSLAVATSLGYQDGEGMPFAMHLLIIQRITASVKVPVTVDMEMGYGKTAESIYANIQRLIEAGVVGINLEDSMITNNNRSLKDANDFARLLEAIRNNLASADMSLFINVRCDTFLLKVNDKENETARRLKLYESAGADGIFLPFISDEKDIARAVASTRLPLNVMAMEGIPSLERLNDLGVKRVSMGPFFQMATYRRAKELATEVASGNSLKPIL